MYIFTMVQHTKDGDVIPPSINYKTELEWKAKYHQEMSYAIASEDIKGLDVSITDNNLYSIFSDHLYK